MLSKYIHRPIFIFSTLYTHAGHLYFLSSSLHQFKTSRDTERICKYRLGLYVLKFSSAKSKYLCPALLHLLCIVYLLIYVIKSVFCMQTKETLCASEKKST